MCVSCSKAGAEDPNYNRKVEEARSQIIVGSVLILAAIAIVALVIFVPFRQGGSPGSKLSLLALAFMAFGGGLERIGSGRREIRGNKR